LRRRFFQLPILPSFLEPVFLCFSPSLLLAGDLPPSSVFERCFFRPGPSRLFFLLVFFSVPTAVPRKVVPHAFIHCAVSRLFWFSPQLFFFQRSATVRPRVAERSVSVASFVLSPPPSPTLHFRHLATTSLLLRWAWDQLSWASFFSSFSPLLPPLRLASFFFSSNVSFFLSGVQRPSYGRRRLDSVLWVFICDPLISSCC